MSGQFMSRLGRVDELGRLYIGIGAPPAGSTFLGGSIVGPLGPAIVDATNPPALFVNGKPVSATGLLCIEDAGVMATFEGGIPLSVTKRICTTNVAPATSSDTFIDKVRINTAKQIHVVDVTPPVFKAWSSGFSTGFGL